jgi:transcriptional antiterminator NusG
MKDPAVIEETTSTSPTDPTTVEPSPVADALADAAELHREADEAEEQVMAEAVAEAVVIEEMTDAAAEETLEEAAELADELEAAGEDEAAQAVVEEGFAEALVIEAAGDAAEEQVLAEGIVEAAVIEEIADETGEELVAEAVAAEPVAAEPEPEVERSAQPEPEVAETTAVEEAPPADDPFGGPGEWYVVHTYAGYENKVKTNLESRIHTMQMEDKIFRVHIPMEDVMEIKSGKKQVVQKKVFPGYLLVKMWYDNDSWYVVRNTPGVTGFVSSGTGSKPTPLSKREIDKILVVKKEEVKPQFRLGFEEGDVVRIISGPFADFNGTINEINVDQSKLKVLVNIFDRETPVELGFDQVSKV